MAIIYGITHDLQNLWNMTTDCYLQFKKFVLPKLTGKSILFITEGLNMGLVGQEDKDYDIYVQSIHPHLLKFCRRNNVDLLFTDQRPYAQSIQTAIELYAEFRQKVNDVDSSIEITSDLPRNMNELETMIKNDSIEWKFKEGTNSDILDSKKLIYKWSTDTDKAFIEEIQKNSHYDHIVLLAGCTHLLNLKKIYKNPATEYINILDPYRMTLSSFLRTYVTFYST